MDCQCQAAKLLPLYRQLTAIYRELLELRELPEESLLEKFRDLAAIEGQLRSLESGLREAELAGAKAQLATLQKRVKALEEAMRTGSRQAGKFQRRNSQRKDPKDHKKPGRKPKGDPQDRGKRDYRKVPKQIDQHIHAPLATCPCCGGSNLSEFDDHQNYLIDIIIRPDVSCYHSQSGHCVDCNTRVQSCAPGQVSLARGAACCSLGPKLIAHAIYLHDYHAMSWRKIADYFNSALRADLADEEGQAQGYVTHGALERAAASIADTFKREYETLIDLLHEGGIIQIDETGWRVSIHQAWLWVFTNPLATVFNIVKDQGRSAQAMAEVLRPEFTGKLVSDFYVVYDSFEGLKQKCLSHFLCALKTLIATDQALLSGFASELSAILRHALSQKRDKPSTGAADYGQACAALETRLDSCIAQYSTLADSDASEGPEMHGRRLLNRAKKYRDELLLFLYHDEVPGTNNTSESRIRRGVCARKTQGCHRTQAGADRYAHSCSLIATEKQHGRDALAKLSDLVSQARAPNAA